MKKEESWRRFEQTGSVIEYLNYSACASEDILADKKENRDDRIAYSDRNCTGNHANRRL